MDPVVAYRFARDVERRPPDELGELKAGVLASPQVAELLREQRGDGGWGRFHSADSRVRRRVPTSEHGVRRARAMGLEPDDVVLSSAIAHMASLLSGEAFPDPPERNERWLVGTRLFVAGTLAEADPHHESLEGQRALWRGVAERAFASGVYDPDAEQCAHEEATGLNVTGTYLEFFNRYTLSLLSRDPKLSSDLSSRILHSLFEDQRSVRYVGASPGRLPDRDDGSQVCAWLTSLELLADMPGIASWAGEATSWLAEAATGPDAWDFGPVRRSSSFPLSKDWRTRGSRQADWSLRIASLISRFRSAP